MMTAPDRTALVRLIRAELEDCDLGVRGCVLARRDLVAANGPDSPLYPLTLLRDAFYAAREATWIDHARRLRDLLAEMGEQP